MARGGFSRRRGRGPSLKLVGILAGVAFLGFVGAVFYYSGQAESRRPEQVEIRVEATNVGPQSQ